MNRKTHVSTVGYEYTVARKEREESFTLSFDISKINGTRIVVHENMYASVTGLGFKTLMHSNICNTIKKKLLH